MEYPEVQYGSDQPIPGKCGAKLRGSDPPRFCQDWPSNGLERCWRHGGKALVGALNPAFKDGSHSRFMPTQIAQRFDAAKSDPELLSTRHSAAVLQARIDELLERVYSGESGAAWREIAKLWREFWKFRTAGNVAKMQEMIELLDEPIRRGIADHAAWEEMGQQMDRHARLADQELRRLDKLQATMTVEDAMAMLGTVLDVIRRHTTPEQQQLIGVELDQLVTLDAVPLAARSRRRRR